VATHRPTTLDHPEGDVRIEPTGARRRLTVVPHDARDYIHVPTHVTSYPIELIREILHAKGPSYVCDEIMRHEDPAYLARHLIATIVGHVDPAAFAGKRLLDFGCGAGASTTILANLLPRTHIVGVELSPQYLAVAEARRIAFGLENVTFYQSPGGDRLPDRLGRFDVVVLSAVFEHMLPEERRVLMPRLFAVLRPGGILFIDETPYRWFPVESHTTGLPLLNYLPDRVAYRCARLFSERVRPGQSWRSLLRAGVRGGTVNEILTLCELEGGCATLMRPSREGMRDWIDLWERGYLTGARGVRGAVKRAMKHIAKLVYRFTGESVVSYLSLAIRKG